MPRSRTWARYRAALLAAGLVQPAPDRTPGRMGQLRRAIWKKIAAHEDRRVGPEGWPDAATRLRTIRAKVDKWAADCAKATRERRPLTD